MADRNPHNRKIRILVIEDSTADRVLLQQRLNCITDPIHAGYVETLAEAAVKKSAPWDVVLLDLYLPGSRGLETLAQAKKIFPDTPIIVLTGLADDALGTTAMQAGAQDYLVKADYNISVLQRSIRHSLERNKLTAELRSERTRLNHILENTSEGIVAISAEGVVVFANRAATRILNAPIEEIAGSKWPYELKTDCLTRITISHPEGEEVVAEMRVAFTRERGRYLYLCNLRNITEEDSLQRGMVEREKMVAVGELSSGIAHEFNNLLAAVQANIELMMLREPENDLARNILTATRRGKSLVQDLMTFNPHKAPQDGETELSNYLKSNREVLNRLLGQNIDLNLHVPETESFVPIGPGKLNQIFINLTVNARDAMASDGGSLTIKVETKSLPFELTGEDEAVSPSWACISFVDTGIGMPPKIKNKIFRAFFTTKGQQGNGLGLNAVKNLVTENGGKITVESEEGVGTRFEIWLPTVASDAAKHTVKSVAPTNSDGDPFRILFVEDEELLRMAMSSYLDTRGFEITSVADGQAALDAIELSNRPFDAVVSDHIMPRLTGKQFIEQAIPLLPEAVFILTSAYDMKMIGRDWPCFDVVKYLPKPYHGHDLHDLIAKQLKLKSSIEATASR